MTDNLPFEGESDPSRPWSREEEEACEGGLRLLAKIIAGAIRRTQQRAQAASDLPPQDAAA